MFGATPVSQSRYQGVLTISTEEGQVFQFIKPNRIDPLPDDLVKAIFIRLTRTSNFRAFSATCKRTYTISCDIPVCAFNAYPLSRLVFMRNKDIKDATLQFIDAVVMESERSFALIDEKIRLCQPTIELQEAQNTFYTTYTRCCFQQNTSIDCEAFFNRYYFASLCITKNYQKVYPLEMHNKIKLKMACVFSTLIKIVYKDIINISTNQLNESVTFHSFKSSVVQIKELFTNKSEIDIEADLRNALREKHGAAFQEYASQCLSAFPTSTVVSETQLQLSAPLLEEKAAIEAELAIMRGPNLSDGTINDAFTEMETLMNMQDEPVDEAQACAAFIALNEALSKEGYSKFHPIYTEMYPEVRTAYAEFLRANESPSVQKREAAKAKFEELADRINTLALWEEGTGTLIGGRLFEVCKKLENIGSIAWFKVRKRGEFYAELACPVTEENKRVRFDFMLKCSDSKPDAP